jgi:nucleoside-diphosphate-sugar epimerase
LKKFDHSSLYRILKDKVFDVVYHLAAYGVNPTNLNPTKLFNGNLDLTANVLLALKHSKINKFIYSGSCAQYAAIEEPYYITEQHPLLPSSLYGAAKAATEIFGRELAATLDYPFITLRLFNMYGPGEAQYRLIPYLIKRLQKKGVVDLTSGEQVRDFLYIDDVISALIAAGNLQMQTAAFNVCSKKPVTIRDIAMETAAQMVVSPKFLNFGSRTYRSNEPMWIVGDNTDFCSKTGWKPVYTLKEGIRKMILELKDQI